MYGGLGKLRVALDNTLYAQRDNVGKLGGLIMCAYYAVRVNLLQAKGISEKEMRRHLTERSKRTRKKPRAD